MLLAMPNTVPDMCNLQIVGQTDTQGNIPRRAAMPATYIWTMIRTPILPLLQAHFKLSHHGSSVLAISHGVPSHTSCREALGRLVHACMRPCCQWTLSRICICTYIEI
jgi:hypothetical protein